MKHYWLKISPTQELSTQERENFSEILIQLAQRFGFAGMQDWQVELGASSRVLGVADEFRDLRAKVDPLEPISIYFHSQKGAKSYAQLLKSTIGDLKISAVRELVKKDWQKEWRKHYRPQKIKNFWITPAWISLPKNHSGIRIYPGQAFGTGTHATTRGCLELFFKIADSLPQKTLILDFGAGTGILALAALAWAKKNKKNWKALAVEIDGEAKKQISKNARANRLPLPNKAKVPAEKKYDLIFANVLQPVLIAEAKTLANSLAPGGKIIFSGILHSEGEFFCEKMLIALAKNSPTSWAISEKWNKGDWAAFIFSQK